MVKTNDKHLDELLEQMQSLGSRPKIWEYAGMQATFESYENTIVLKASKEGMADEVATKRLYDAMQASFPSSTPDGKPVSFLPYYQFEKKVA